MPPSENRCVLIMDLARSRDRFEAVVTAVLFHELAVIRQLEHAGVEVHVPATPVCSVGILQFVPMSYSPPGARSRHVHRGGPAAGRRRDHRGMAASTPRGEGQSPGGVEIGVVGGGGVAGLTGAAAADCMYRIHSIH